MSTQDRYTRLYAAVLCAVTLVLLLPAIAAGVTVDVPVGAYPSAAVVYTGSTPAKIYVADYYGYDVCVIGGDTDAEIAPRIGVGPQPMAMACDLSLQEVYALRAGGISDVTVIDAATDTWKDDIGLAGQATDIAVDDALDDVYVATWGPDNSVAVIHRHDPSLPPDLVAVGTNPGNLVVDSEKHWVYVANAGSNDVSVIDGGQEPPAVVATINTGGQPGKMALDPASHKVYVVCSGSNEVTVIDGGADRPSVPSFVKNIVVGSLPNFVAVDSLHQKVYVTNGGGYYASHDVSVIDSMTDTEILPRIHAGPYPYDVAVDPALNLVYVTNYFTNNMTVIDAGNGNTTTDVPVGGTPAVVELNPQTHKAYVLNGTSDTVTVYAPPLPPTTHVIKATAGPFGSITPSGDVPVVDGGSQAFVISPDFGYHVGALTVDGVVDSTFDPAGGSYSFTNVTTDRTIAVRFDPNVYMLTYVAQAGGEILDIGFGIRTSVYRLPVQYNTYGPPIQALPKNPNVSYFTGWLEDGFGGPYRIDLVTGDATYTATFSKPNKQHSFKITYKCSPGGAGVIGPSGAETQFVLPGQNGMAVTALPAKAGWVFDHWSDGNTCPDRQEFNVNADMKFTAIYVKSP